MQMEATVVAKRIDALVDASCRSHSVDVVIRVSSWGVIAETGFGGSCYEKNLVTVAVDPENEGFVSSIRDCEFAGSLAHELHHSFRHASVGYGDALGEALVPEGLADRFSTEVTDFRRPIWTNIPGLTLDLIDRGERELEKTSYDHPAWFYAGTTLPRWAGYTIGLELVSAYLSKHPDQTAGTLATMSADVILNEGWPAMRSNIASKALQ